MALLSTAQFSEVVGISSTTLGQMVKAKQISPVAEAGHIKLWDTVQVSAVKEAYGKRAALKAERSRAYNLAHADVVNARLANARAKKVELAKANGNGSQAELFSIDAVTSALERVEAALARIEQVTTKLADLLA